MSAEILRRAASRTRAAAEKCCQCTDGHHDWTYIYGTESDVRMSRDAARAVANWLDDLANRITLSRQLRHEDEERHALVVARAYLGEQS